MPENDIDTPFPYALVTQPDTEYAGHTLRPEKYRTTAYATRKDDGIIDDVAVRRAIDGHTIALSGRELAAAIIHCATVKNLDDFAIGERLGMTHHAVLKTRNRHDVPGQPTGFNVDRHDSYRAAA